MGTEKWREDKLRHQLSEQKVLKKLGIEDFNHLTKGKAISFASMLERMDPDVAKEALEQFPEFSSTMQEMLHEYKDTLEKGMISNDKSVQAFYTQCNAIIASLQKELDKDDLSFEGKKYIIEQMKDVANMTSQKDTENKKWLAGIACIAGTVVAGLITALASVLGSNTRIELQDDKGCESRKAK